MKKLMLIAVLALVGLDSFGQREIVVYIQDYQTKHGSLYYDMHFGLKTYCDNNYKDRDSVYYSPEYHATIELRLSDDWLASTLEFVNEVREGEDKLYVLVGHNLLLDTAFNTNFNNCSPNMLFGCFTNYWELDNTLIDTYDLMAPESYTVIPAIEKWLEGEEDRIRVASSYAYANAQHISIERASNIFGYEKE